MFEQDKIINKINNLLELSKNNKNINESTVAILKAKELMQRHNLSEAILEEKTQTLNKKIIDSIRDKNESLNKGKIEEWQACLANVLCNRSHCKCYLTSIENDGEIEDAISVIGYEKDVKFVFMLYSFLSLELVTLAMAQEGSSEPLYKENFILGAIKKIGVRLQEEQNRVNEEFRRTTKFNNISGDFAIQYLDNKNKNIDSYLRNLNLKNQNKNIENPQAFGKGYVKADSLDLMQNQKIN